MYINEVSGFACSLQHCGVFVLAKTLSLKKREKQALISVVFGAEGGWKLLLVPN